MATNAGRQGSVPPITRTCTSSPAPGPAAAPAWAIAALHAASGTPRTAAGSRRTGDEGERRRLMGGAMGGNAGRRAPAR
jgi:hypothetical protein